MKDKKNQPLNFNNVCGIRTYLAIAISNEVREHKKVKGYWGVKSSMTNMSRRRISDMICSYRAAQNIKIVH